MYIGIMHFPGNTFMAARTSILGKLKLLSGSVRTTSEVFNAASIWPGNAKGEYCFSKATTPAA